MPLPAIAAAARAGGAAIKGTRKAGSIFSFLGGANESEQKRPYVLSVEGVSMLALAVFVEIANIVLAVLDIALGLGTVLAVVLNAAAALVIGGWLWLRTGQLPIKKALLPFGLNSIPLVRLFPFWLWSVWTNLDKNPPQQQELKQSRVYPNQKKYADSRV